MLLPLVLGFMCAYHGQQIVRLQEVTTGQVAVTFMNLNLVLNQDQLAINLHHFHQHQNQE